MGPPRAVGLLGGGVIGGGWAARFVLNGVDVRLYDPDPDAERKVGEVLANARRAYGRLTHAPLPPEGRITLVPTPEEAVEGVELVQESAPEREQMKRELLARASRAASDDAIFASSTSGLLPSRLQRDMARPQRLCVGHPFNPVYLLPLVEVCAGELTDPETVTRAADLYRSRRHVPARSHAGDRRLRRRPPARGALARSALAGRRRDGDGRRDRRRHHATAPAFAGRAWARSSPTGSPAARPACGTSWSSSGPRSSGPGRG